MLIFNISSNNLLKMNASCFELRHKFQTSLTGSELDQLSETAETMSYQKSSSFNHNACQSLVCSINLKLHYFEKIVQFDRCIMH